MALAQTRAAVYSFGFNGMEKDDDVCGATGTSLDFGARMLDPRVGRFLSMDALAAQLLQWSPYTSLGDNPIAFVDPDGNRFVFPKDKHQRRLLKATLRELKRSSEIARFHIMRIAKDQKEVTLVMDDRDNQFLPTRPGDAMSPGVGSGGTLIWNPDKLDITPDQQADGTSVVSHQRALLEEVVHASRSIAGEGEYNDAKAGFPEGWATPFETASEEISTNQIVNDALSQMGQSSKRRLSYSFHARKYDSEWAIIDKAILTVPIPGAVPQPVEGGNEVPGQLPLILGSERQPR